MIIDLSSPVELRGYELLHDDAGSVRAYIDLCNVSDETLTGYGATARWTRDGTNESANDSVSVDAIAIPGGGEFRLMLVSPLKYADRLELYFSSARFESGETWTPKDGALVDVGEAVPLEGVELDLLKQKAGEDAQMYPETQDDFWRCVCGRINPLSSELCARCRRERNYVLSELNRKTVNLTEEQAKSREKRKRRTGRVSSKREDAEAGADLYLKLLAAITLVFLVGAILVTALS